MLKKLFGKSDLPELVIEEPWPDELEEALEEYAAKRKADLKKLIDLGDDSLKWYICKWQSRMRWTNLISDDPAFYKRRRMIVKNRQGEIIYDLPPTKKK